MKKLWNWFKGKWMVFAMAIGLVMASGSVAFAAGSPFDQLGNGTLPSFATNPLGAARQLLALIVLVLAGWRMLKEYAAGRHKLVYAAALVLFVIEWVLWSPDTLFAVVQNALTWMSNNWFGGGGSGTGTGS